MRLGEYLEVNKKLKTARSNSGITQADMAKRLKLSTSAYSNYENGYSEPPVEVLKQFCQELGITISELLQLEIVETKRKRLETYAEFLDDLLQMQEIGIRANYSQELKKMNLQAIYTFDSPQLATMGTGIEELNQKLAAGEIKQEEYDWRIENIRQMFNVKIKDYVF